MHSKTKICKQASAAGRRMTCNVCHAFVSQMAFLTFRIEYYRKKWIEERENQLKTEIDKLQFEEDLCNVAIAREKQLVEFFATSGSCLPCLMGSRGNRDGTVFYISL